MKARYADTNFQLLGAVVTVVEGRPLREVFTEDLFVPLGLDDTSCYPNRPRSGRSVEPDACVWSKQVVLRPAGMLTTQVPDGGLIATVADQVALMRALVTGAVFDDPETWERMRSGWHRVMFPIEYGLGVMRYAPVPDAADRRRPHSYTRTRQGRYQAVEQRVPRHEQLGWPIS